ncbi:PBSX family phage terminase large subunit [Bacillus pseudomycoides]|uniref:PBSX family phage terminase large subunit n=1 Tax=Bacillus pseudomycoides TaxID=64104 RepID=UPI000BEBFD30|nr:PBSX family phage terminase large subunit [Bacillus pseudomycoides]PEE04595.1 PBSX family phage terminase large subunit [Bacillus pseudomycoides]PEJ40003.1 PBSX family phage terminase large subunit [Bacillus pseudomycoides]PGE91998.1 PBSX family phage terminase large subunit [Bacillus pseudomycoides]PHA94509.1 PBSX family phage terminase large subunit [Bacillus pseudomycoides]PHC71196.1 PBSX family phage terminase large subunit [Bacillus pseudomycoides]
MTKTVNIMDVMNVNFYSLWLAEQSHIVAKGGRSSMKSSVISMKLITDFLEDEQGNVVCLRKVGKYLSTSIYEQIKWAIYMLGVEGEFYFGKSPLIIRHKKTNTAFYFYGCDDPLKLKSAKIAKGYVMSLWFEEAAEFAGVEDIDIVEDTFIRQEIEGKEVKVYFSYNPPRNPYSWINEWLDSKAGDDDYFIHHSTYMDDKKGFLSQQMIRKIEKYKVHDLDYWRWMYGGEVIGLGDMVYNMNHIQEIDELPKDDDIILIDTTSDTGHQVSATTHLALAFTKKRNVILLDTYYYSPANKVVKKAPSELSKDLKEWMDSIVEIYKRYFDKQTIDSAEGALRNQFFKDYGIRLHPVAKKKKIDMIDNVQDLMAQGRFFVLNTERNKIFIEEHKKYQWDADTLQSDDPKIIKVDDHTCDAFQYYVNDNLSKLGLKY